MQHLLFQFFIFFESFLFPLVNVAKGFPGGTSGKESAWQCRRHKRWCLIAWSGRSPGGEVAAHSSIPAWKIYGQLSLVGYCPWGHRESDTTEQLSTHSVAKYCQFYFLKYLLILLIIFYFPILYFIHIHVYSNLNCLIPSVNYRLGYFFFSSLKYKFLSFQIFSLFKYSWL